MLTIPRGDLRASRRKPRLLDHAAPTFLDAIVSDLLAIMSRVGLTAPAIKISFAHGLRRQSESACYAIDDLFDDEHALRSAEAPEPRVRSQIRLRHAPGKLHGREIVGVIQMKQRAV